MPSRRSVLAALSAGAASALTGCRFGSNDRPSETPPADGTGSPTGESSATSDATATRTPTATLTPTGTPAPTPTDRRTPSPTATQTPPPTPTETETETTSPPPTAVASLTASDAESYAEFGGSLASVGDAVLVGAEGADAPGAEDAVGAAYAFERVDGTWTQTARLAPESGDPEGRFGHAGALSGDRALIAASELSGTHTISSGAAYVYDRSGDDWTRAGTLSTPDDDRDAFGDDVALSGDTVVAGAPHARTGDDAVSGAAHVFERVDGGWERTATLAPDDGGDHDDFGRAVVLDGDRALVGAPGEPDGTGQGAVYAFARSDGSWTQRAKLVPPERDSEDYVGASLSLEGDRVLVAAPGEDDPNGYFGGAAHTFVASDGEWTHEAKLLPDDGDESDAFGESVALRGDTALVGAEHDEEPNGEDAGSAFLFSRAGAEWAQEAKLLPPDGGPGELFGSAATLTDEFGVVGAFYDDHSDIETAGSAFVFEV
ncbi:hypothetical protein [Halosimplex salinum]|uniref:hypothetical protein n=1 Tax=Halosimplex salinum TaxID=1710538 RepID=UPI000F4836AE|nr:hypothetical protein [Halosimplex salinum]